MQSVRTVFLLLITTTLALSSFVLGQSTARVNPGPLDVDVAIPASTGILGHKDAAALAEVVNHRVAVGSDPWIGMQAIGKISYATDTTEYETTFSNLGGDRFRLDAQTSKGEESIRIDGRIGKIQGSDGRIFLIPSDTASLELFPFEMVRTANFPGPEASLLDRGIVSVGGVQLHRITYEFPSIASDSVAKLQQVNAIDLYFDPISHLLIKSASLILLADSRPIRFLSVVTYGDYRKVGTSMIPFRYTESLEGQQSRTLHISDIQLNPTLSSTYFDF